MAFKAKWDETGERLYETGVDRGMHYMQTPEGKYNSGVPWNGLTGVTESPSGADETTLWADNIKYLSMRGAEEYGNTITAYTYPDQFGECDGSASPSKGITLYQQKRKTFGMCYRTLIGNDTEMNDHGYKLHLVYGLTASPSDRDYSTVNDSPEGVEFSWECSSVPVAVEGFKPVSLLTIDSTKVDKEKLSQLEYILYGSTEAPEKDPELPLPDEVLKLFGVEGMTVKVETNVPVAKAPTANSSNYSSRPIGE